QGDGRLEPDAERYGAHRHRDEPDPERPDGRQHVADLGRGDLRVQADHWLDDHRNAQLERQVLPAPGAEELGEPGFGARLPVTPPFAVLTKSAAPSST